MHGRGGWRRRGFAVAAVALTFAVVAPSLAAPAAALSSRAELAGKRRKPVSPAVRKARILAAMRAKGAAKARAAAATPPPTAYGGAKKPTANAGAGTKAQRALAAKRQAAKRAALKRRAAAAALAAKRAPKKNKTKSKSLSLPTLVGLAVLPFLLIGIYLLAADFLRRRVPRKRSASLVITRVSDR